MTLVAASALRRTPVVDAPTPFDMVSYARLHRQWVADHGPGCARSMAHLADYVPGHRITDPWGSKLHLECARVVNPYGWHYELAVTVRSNGPDRILGTEDDLVGSDTADAGPVPENEETATSRILEDVRYAAIAYLGDHRECFHTGADLRAGQYADLRLIDAWRSPIAVDCIGRTVTATSPGPDRVVGSADDLSIAETID